MNAKLRKIDERGEILANLYDAGRISEARFLAAIRELVAQAEAILAKMG